MTGRYKKFRFNRLIYKFVIPFTLIVLFVFIILIPVVISLSKSVMEKQTNEYLLERLSSTTEIINNEREDLQRDLKLLIAIPMIEEALREKDTALLTKLLLPVKESLHLNFLAAIDERKEAIVMFHESAVTHEEMMGIDIIDKGLLGIQASSLYFINSKPFIAAVNASTTRDDVSIIIGGKSLEKSLTSKSRRYTDANKLFIYDVEGRGMTNTSGEWGTYMNVPTRILSSILRAKKPIAEKLIYKKENTPELMLFAPIKIYGEIKAILGIDFSMEEMVRTRNKIIKFIVALMFTGMFLISILGYFILKKVLSRIDNLLNGTRKITDGKVGYQIAETSGDEIGDLAVSFNQMSRSLLMSHEWWANTFDSMIDGVSIHDVNRNILRANTALSKTLGIPAEQLIGKKCFQVFHNSACPIKNCPMNECKALKEPGYIETFEPHLDRWTSISISPVMNEEDEVEKIIHITRDITKRKRAENIIKTAKIEWEMTFDSSSELIAIVDKNFKIMRCNMSFAQFAYKEPDDLIGTLLSETIPIDCDQLDIERPIRGIDLKLGEEKWLYVSYCPIRDKKGNLLRSVFTGTDISTLKNTQEMLCDSERELKERVNDLEKFFDVAVNRELKMVELKKKINNLDRELVQIRNNGDGNIQDQGLKDYIKLL